jgi:hypothetical protein
LKVNHRRRPDGHCRPGKSPRKGSSLPFAQEQIERKPARRADEDRCRDDCQALPGGQRAVGGGQHDQRYHGDDDVPREKGTDGIGKQIIDEPRDVESMFG